MKTIVSRLLWNFVTFCIIVTATFVLVRMAPGGPFDKDKPLPAAIEQVLKEQYCLDRPVAEQYFMCFVPNVLKGELGPSYNEPARKVSEKIREGLPKTAVIGGLALLAALTLGIALGIVASLRHNRLLDHVITGAATIGVIVPEFVIGPLLIFTVSFKFKLVGPTSTNWDLNSRWDLVVLPVATLTLYYLAVISRYTRGGMLEVLREAYIRTAQGKGLSAARTIVRHSLWGGLRPVLTYTGVAVAGIFGGSTLVVESIFVINGVAGQFITALTNRDYTMILGTTMTFAAILLLMNTVVDVAYVLIDPRLRRRK